MKGFGLHVYWYALPLIAAISLVYSASRHEEWPRIWRSAARLAGSIVAVMLIAGVLLLLLNSQVDG